MHYQIKAILSTPYMYQYNIEIFLNCIKRQLGIQKHSTLKSKDLSGSITTAKSEVIFRDTEPETIIETCLSGKINFKVLLEVVSITGTGALGLFRVKTAPGRDAHLD